MDLSNVSTVNLKKLKIYSDFRDDPLFKGVMQVLRNDAKIKQIKEKIYYGSVHGVVWPASVLAGIIPQLLYVVSVLIFAIKDWSLASFGGRFTLLLFMAISVWGNCFVAGDYDTEYITDKKVNCVIVVLTYVLLRFFKFSIWPLVPLSITVQCLISAVVYCVKCVPSIKEDVEENLSQIKCLEQEKQKANTYYESVHKMLEERVAICNAELQRRGSSPVCPLGSVWWEKSADWLDYDFGHFFNDEHNARYKATASYDAVDYSTMQVAGRTDHEFTLQIHKEFFMFTIPKHKNADIFEHMKEKNFQCMIKGLYPNFDVNTCDIYAIGCKWTKFDIDKSQTTMHRSPTQSQIDDARRGINQRRDADERLHNAITKGVALSVDEMFYATGGKGVSWQEQMASEGQRRNDLDKFIRNNTYDEVSHDSNARKSDGMAVFMYIVNGVPYYTEQPPFCFVSDKYSLERSSKWIWDRRDEAVSALEHLVRYEPRIANVIVGNIWNGCFLSEEDEEMYSRVMHSFATSEAYQKYFKR